MTGVRDGRSVAHGGLLLTLLAAGWLHACSDTPPPPQCHDIPTAGCPEDNGADPCTDVTCAAVYACQNGSWVLVKSCPNYSPDAGPTPVDASADASPFDATGIDAPPGAFGGPGCADLQSPDCSLGTALTCGAAQDCCGCVDLYVCNGGGWDLWGECVDGGPARNP
jgi:hypothetical protein